MQSLTSGQRPQPHFRSGLDGLGAAPPPGLYEDIESPAPPPRPGDDAAARLVQIQGVTKVFGAGPAAMKALDDVSLTIMANEFFTLALAIGGATGAAKAAGDLFIYNWTDYTNPDLIKKFEGDRRQGDARHL